MKKTSEKVENQTLSESPAQSSTKTHSQVSFSPCFENANSRLFHGDSLRVLESLPSRSVQCCVTSPPYFGLRDYGVEGQIGLESTIQDYVDALVQVFREVRRVLRDDGTLFLNIGDSYAGSGRGGYKDGISGLDGSIQGQDQSRIARGSQLNAGLHESVRKSGSVGRAWVPPPKGLKAKDLMGIPWEVAFALRSDGWFLRSEIIWAKRSPMPESVKDRPTKSHEQIFLLSKSSRYFWDSVASQESAVSGNNGSSFTKGKTARKGNSQLERCDYLTRNMRSVWSLSSSPLKASHFAAFPPELVRRCLVAGVSEYGCCEYCGAPFIRETKQTRVATRTGKKSKINSIVLDPASPYQSQQGDICGNRDPKRHVTKVETVGFKPSCTCIPSGPQPCVVLDPFHGAGTTWKVCERLGLNYIGIELNHDYIELSINRPKVRFPHEVNRKKLSSEATPMLIGFDN